ncbi:MAG: FecCD family ABC transporter permease [Acidaminococcus sp.]|uniref:FecCD family ABC transporter permease n=1 Tax=Acidaminococcus sp. TaxID=1872103 RepID=UPI003F17F209
MAMAAKTPASRHFRLWLGLSLVLLAAMFYIHLRTGFNHLSDEVLWQVLLGRGTEAQNLTVFDFRMVRSVLAVLIGSGLAMAGSIFQTISRNELASPSLLGVNAGAGLLVMLLIDQKSLDASLGFWEIPVAAVLGGTMAALAIYGLAYKKGRTLSPYTLVLTGISLTAGIHALQMLLVVRLDPQKFHVVNAWIIGSISGNTWAHVWTLLPVVLVLGLLLWSRSQDLNLLSLTDETAIGLGLPLNRARFLYLMVAVVLAACCVAIGGNIGFVGLICPHIARRLAGADFFRLLPLTAILGALLVLSADWVARVIIAPDEMLLGIVVSLIGAPYFLYILVRTGK